MENLGLTFGLKDSDRTLRFIDSCFHLGAHTQTHTRTLVITRKILTYILRSLRDPMFTIRLTKEPECSHSDSHGEPWLRMPLRPGAHT